MVRPGRTPNWWGGIPLFWPRGLMVSDFALSRQKCWVQVPPGSFKTETANNYIISRKELLILTNLK